MPAFWTSEDYFDQAILPVLYFILLIERTICHESKEASARSTKHAQMFDEVFHLSRTRLSHAM
jgi:hypothetical protein